MRRTQGTGADPRDRAAYCTASKIYHLKIPCSKIPQELRTALRGSRSTKTWSGEVFKKTHSLQNSYPRTAL